MKTLYSILLVVIFIIHGDAQPGILSYRQPIKDTIDSTVVLAINSSDSPKDSITLINEEVPAPKKPKTINGVASFYSKSLEGTETATGETFKHTKYTAASNNFPLNTWVRVTNLRNCKSVIVRINDRMHPRMAKKGRVVDLTISAAKKIGLTSRIGITKVSVEEVEKDTEQ